MPESVGRLRIALLTLVLTLPSVATGGMAWQADLPSAMHAAAQDGRLIVLHFWSPTCPPCLKMERQVFSQAGISGALANNFVAVKINSNSYPAIATKYGIRYLPTDIVLAPDGQVLAKLEGATDARGYVERLNRVAAARRGTQVPGTRYGTQRPSNAAGNHAGVVGAATSGQIARQGSRFATGTRSAPPTMNDNYAAPPQNPAYQNASQFTGVANPARPVNAPLVSNYRATAGQTPTPSPYSDWTQNPGVSAGAPQAQSNPPGWSNQQAGANQQAAVRQTTQTGYQPAPQYPSGPPVAGSYTAARQQPSINPQSQLPVSGNARPSMGLEGYCPVNLLRKQQWVAGNPRIGVNHRGHTYLFAGEAERQIFMADPDRYSPVAAGNDPVLALSGQMVPGNRRHGVYFQNRIYLFANDQSLVTFSQSPDRYATQIMQAMRQTPNTTRQ